MRTRKIGYASDKYGLKSLESLNDSSFSFSSGACKNEVSIVAFCAYDGSFCKFNIVRVPCILCDSLVAACVKVSLCSVNVVSLDDDDFAHCSAHRALHNHKVAVVSVCRVNHEVFCEHHFVSNFHHCRPFANSKCSVNNALKRICTTDASFAGWLLAVAAVAGGILGIFAVWRRSGQGMKARLKTGLITFCCSLALIWFLLSFGGSAANYAFDFSEGTAVDLRMTGKEIDVHRKGPADYELQFGGISVSVPLDVYKEAEVGDSFLFYRYQGAFGLEYYEFTERK